MGAMLFGVYRLELWHVSRETILAGVYGVGIVAGCLAGQFRLDVWAGLYFVEFWWVCVDDKPSG